jgi:hypothetical protein
MLLSSFIVGAVLILEGILAAEILSISIEGDLIPIAVLTLALVITLPALLSSFL